MASPLSGPTLRLSIVIPTFNRLGHLQDTLSRLRANVSIPHELIVVDGGSTDGTRPFLAERPDVVTLLEARREGAVRAFNKGFRKARGENVMWLNDDAYPLPGSIEAALAMLDRYEPAGLGMVAFYHDWDRTRNALDAVERDGTTYRVYAVRGVPYANFGLLRRALLTRLDFVDERYFFFGFDPDLSLKVQRQAGRCVVGCRQALIRHEEHHCERKRQDLAAGRADNEKLFDKWSLPAPGAYPDPVPGYQALLARFGQCPAPAA